MPNGFYFPIARQYQVHSVFSVVYFYPGHLGAVDVEMGQICCAEDAEIPCDTVKPAMLAISEGNGLVGFQAASCSRG